MYWGLVLKSNKRYSQQIHKGFHVSNATLDLSTIEKDANISVWVHTDGEQHLLCNLSKQIPQVALDLIFSEGETIAFFTKGNGTVHLNGNIQDEDEFGDLGEMGDEEQDDEELGEDEEMDYADLKKALLKKSGKGGKKSNNDDDDDDSDEDDDLEGDEDSDLGDEESDEDDDEEDDEEDDDEDDEDDDESDSEAETKAPPAKQAKLDKQAKLQNGLTNGKAHSKQQKEKNKDEQSKKQQQQQQKGAVQEQSKKDKKDQQQQQKNQGKKTLASGVVIEDLRVGKGPEATAGKRVTVYYTGRLQKNNKVFDSSTSGEGFRFNLGRNEVIRGWDIGVAGMRVGGKRRIICPANAAYGAKGAPPSIPPNSTLVFDVELRSM